MHKTGPVPGRVRQQRQHGQTNQERIGRRPAHQAKRHTQRLPLRPRKPIQALPEGHQQLVNGGETQTHLGLGRHHPHDLQIRGPVDRVVEQRRLSHPRLAPQHEGAAHPGPHAVEHVVQRLLLSAAVHQPHRRT
jgi:hypothetical protein